MAPNRAAGSSDPNAWIATVGRVMSHPTRIELLLAIARAGTASPSDAAAAASLDLGTSSYHVRTLVRLGVIRLRSTGRVRGATEHFYELSSDGRAAVRAIEAVAAVKPKRSSRRAAGGRGGRAPRRR